MAPIIPQKLAPVNRSHENDGFYRLCFTKEHQAEKWRVDPLNATLMILQQRKNNNGSFPYKRNWSTPRVGLHIVEIKSTLHTVFSQADNHTGRQQIW